MGGGEDELGGGDELPCTQVEDNFSLEDESPRLVLVVDGVLDEHSAIELPEEAGVLFKIGRDPSCQLVLSDDARAPTAQLVH